MTFSPSSPPAPAMFGLGALWPLAPLPAAVDWSAKLDSTQLQSNQVDSLGNFDQGFNDASSGSGSGLGQIVQGLDDVDQCVRIILSTPPGSDPLRPTFACDLFSYIDKPLTTVRAYITRDAVGALSLWEPRITVISVTAAAVSNPGQLRVVVVWRLKLAGAQPAPKTTTVTIAGALTGAGG
jgi:phage baseplate assembly protein W